MPIKISYKKNHERAYGSNLLKNLTVHVQFQNKKLGTVPTKCGTYRTAQYLNNEIFFCRDKGRIGNILQNKDRIGEKELEIIYTYNKVKTPSKFKITMT